MLTTILNILLISFKEREDLVDLFIKIDQDKCGIEESKHRVKTIYKKNLPTSPGLVQSLETINRKYPYSSAKKGAFRFLAIIGLAFGWFLYGFDVFTDFLFTLEMYNLSKTNFKSQFPICEGNWPLNYSLNTFIDSFKKNMS